MIAFFKHSFPIVETNQELDTIKNNFPKLDPYYVTSGCSLERRKKLEDLWQKFAPYADRHFLKQYMLNGHFHQRTWEMYVGCLFLENGFSLKSSNKTPDFTVDDTFYVECIAPTKGENDYRVPEPNSEILMNIPEQEMILRVLGAIDEKYSKIKGELEEKPFILAINTGDLFYPQETDIPLIVKAVFGIGCPTVNIKTGDVVWRRKEFIPKGETKIYTNIFLSDKYKFISGIIFSPECIINSPVNIGKDCLFVHNPFAANPIDDKVFGFLRQCRNFPEESRLGFF